MQRVNNGARPERWRHKAVQFICGITDDFEEGYFFLASREVASKTWRDHSFRLGEHKQAISEHFAKFSRDEYDHYFCPNNFQKPQRKAENAQPTNRAWVDIDGADPERFDPQPNVLLKTSPGRHQGLWFFEGVIDSHEAELYSKALAYRFGADKNGWSATKYLRVPFTYNHKKEYDRPQVRLLKFDAEPQKRKAVPIGDEIWQASNAPVIHVRLTISDNWRKIYGKYRDELHKRVRFLIESDRAYAFESDRSKCIYEIVADMVRVGAPPQDIATILWNNSYFLAKHGKDLGKLNEELWRILERLGASHDL